MTSSKGLKRLLFFVVFLIPVAWYLFLQLFGSNTFSLEEPINIPAECNSWGEMNVLVRADSLDPSRQNQLNRVTYASRQKEIVVLTNQSAFFQCCNIEADVLLVDSDGIWGAYILDREGVDRFLTELDILLIQKSYGKGVSR